MKKLILAFSLLFCINAQADIISYDQFTNTTTITELNTALNKVYTDYNGNISTLNIKSGTLSDDDFAVASRPSTRDYELIGDMTYSGMLPATSANLTSNISLGTSYVNGYRVVTDTTSKTYTASKDTYVYIDQNGAFQYVEVANGATTPTTPANSLLLAKVVTNGTAITSVTDLRQTTPLNLRIYQDVKSGCVISRDTATATTVTIGRGEVELGGTSKVRRNTSSANVDFTTTGKGGLDTGTLSAGNFYYIFAVADSDNTTNFEGIASLSSTDAAGVTGERLVGWCYANANNAISPDSIGAYKGLGGDAPNISRLNKSDVTSVITSANLVNIDTLQFYSSGRPVEISYLVNGTTGADNALAFSVMSIDSIAIPESISGTPVHTLTAGYAGYGMSSNVIRKLDAGIHTLEVKLKANNDFTVRNYSFIVEEK